MKDTITHFLTWIAWGDGWVLLLAVCLMAATGASLASRMARRLHADNDAEVERLTSELAEALRDNRDLQRGIVKLIKENQRLRLRLSGRDDLADSLENE